jgi:hypothetical protein
MPQWPGAEIRLRPSFHEQDLIAILLAASPRNHEFVSAA